MQQWIANHTVLAEVALADLELRLDHQHDVASVLAHPRQCRHDHRKGDERQIRHDEPDLSPDVVGLDVADVGAIKDVDPLV